MKLPTLVGATLPQVLMGTVSTPEARQASWTPVRGDVARDRRISAAGHAIYAILVDAGAGDVAYQKGQRHLAAAARCHVNTAATQLHVLEDCGYIVVQPQAIVTGGLVRRVTDAIVLVGMRGVKRGRRLLRDHLPKRQAQAPDPAVSDVSDSSQSTVDGGARYVNEVQGEDTTELAAAEAIASVRAWVKPSPKRQRWRSP